MRNSYLTGNTIKDLREHIGYTQKQLADELVVSDKTISKWETGKGYPDITLLEPLAKALQVSIPELLSGDCIINQNRSGNMRKSRFYVCPVCGNVITTVGESMISCCGITLPEQEPEEADATHEMHIERIENDYVVTMDHPMTKDHYISFVAHVTVSQVLLIKLYPEQTMEVRIPVHGRGYIYAYCNRHGLVRQII